MKTTQPKIQNDVADLLNLMEKLRPAAKKNKTERSLDRSMTWLMDLVAVPLTKEEQELWGALRAETAEAECDGHPEEYIYDSLKESASIEDARQDVRKYLEDTAEMEYQEERDKYVPFSKMKPAEQTKYLRRAKDAILEKE